MLRKEEWEAGWGMRAKRVDTEFSFGSNIHLSHLNLESEIETIHIAHPECLTINIQYQKPGKHLS